MVLSQLTFIAVRDTNHIPNQINHARTKLMKIPSQALLWLGIFKIVERIYNGKIMTSIKKEWKTFYICILTGITLLGCNCLTCDNKDSSAPSNTLAYSGGQNLSIWTTQNFQSPISLTGGPFDGDPAWGKGKREIFFDRNYPGSPEFRIWKMKWNGQGQSPFTPQGIYCISPAPSPDGKHVAFNFWNDTLQRLDIGVMNIDGSGWMVLTDSGRFPISSYVGFHVPTWTRDGSKIGMVFHKSGREQYGIGYFGVLDMNTRNFTVITQIDSVITGQAVFSPTRDELIFIGGMDFSIFIVNLDGSGLKELVGPENYGLDWSPDGNEIIFDHADSSASINTSQSSFWVMNRDGTNKHVVVPYTGTDIMSPAWK
jgi:Tol biopolymer transport system component